MRHLVLELHQGAAALAVLTSPICVSVSAPVLPTLPLVTLLVPAPHSDCLNTRRAAQESVLGEARFCPALDVCRQHIGHQMMAWCLSMSM